MIYAIITADIFGLIIISIIFCSILIDNNDNSTDNKTYKNRVFNTLLGSIFAAILIDAISYSIYLFVNLYWLNYTLAQIAFLIPTFITAVYIMYLYVYYKEKAQASNKLFKVGLYYSIFIMIIGLILSITKQLFDFIDGVYYPGPLYNLYIIFFVISCIYIIFLILYYRKTVKYYETLVALAFLLFPAIGLSINWFNHRAAFSTASLSLSVLTVYLVLQYEENTILDKLYLDALHKSKTDNLTGLLNRLAYDEKINNLPNLAKTTGIIFSDLNCLKYTNDNEGHVAGDQLLKDYANLLIKYFRKDDVYRISGDEFVCIMPHIPIEVYYQKINDIKEEINSMELPIAAIGGAYGKTNDIEQLIAKAEMLMYEDKEEFHAKYPIYDRRLSN